VQNLDYNKYSYVFNDLIEIIQDAQIKELIVGKLFINIAIVLQLVSLF